MLAWNELHTFWKFLSVARIRVLIPAVQHLLLYWSWPRRPQMAFDSRRERVRQHGPDIVELQSH